MSAATSAVTGQIYGVKRVCPAWELARSSYYVWCTERQDGAERLSPLRAQLAARTLPTPARRRHPA